MINNWSKMTHRASDGVQIPIQFGLSQKCFSLPNPDAQSQASRLILAWAVALS